MGNKAISAVIGLGFSELSRKPVGTTRELAADAVRAAVIDSGLDKSKIDGLLLNRSPIALFEELPMELQDDLGLYDLRLLNSVEAEGSSSVQMLQQATMAITLGMANAVVCVFSDAPLVPAEGGGAGDAFAIHMPMTGIDGWEQRYGFIGATGGYAMAAQRHMALYGTTPEHLGGYAIACREWASLSDIAFLKKPLSMDDYLASRPIVEPFRMFDCCYPVNGAIAVVVTGCEQARDCDKKPVYIHGMGQGHAGMPGLAGYDRETTSGAKLAGQGAYEMAGVSPRDVTVAQFYDAFSYVGMVQLEDYGFCAPGESGPFIADGNISPGGSLPVNTGGGQLSGYYLQGMTPISEAVIQGRGDGGSRQVDNNDLILVSGNGGRLQYHAALIMSPMETLS
jgi:acetyl-CoA acetyltransferase